MRSFARRRGLALTAVVALTLAACGDGEEQAAPEDVEGEELDEDTSGDEPGGQDVEDPNDDIEDGVYRGNGVVLPVPDGWSIDPGAFQQGVVAAVSEDQEQYFSAQAIDTEQAEAAGQDLGMDTVLEQVRSQFEEEAEVDEEVELENAERAHRLTFESLPAPQGAPEDTPEQGATIVFAESGDGLFGQFEFAAPVEDYDEELESMLLAEAGFDEDSEPPAIPQPQPAPEGQGELSPEDMEELEDMLEEQGQDQGEDQG